MDKNIKTFDHKKTCGYTDVTNIQLNSTLLVTYVDVLFWMMLKAFSLFFLYRLTLLFFFFLI